MFNSMKFIKHLSPSVLRTTVYLVLIIFLISFFHTVFVYYDGRSITDHDFHYLNIFGRIFQQTLSLHTWNNLFAQLNHNISYPYVFLNAVLTLFAYLGFMDLFTLRMLLLPFYISMVLGTFFLGKKMSNTSLGLLGSFLVATLPIYDLYSRKYFPYFPIASIFIWIHLLAILLMEKHSPVRIAIPLGVLLGVAYITHPSALFHGFPIILFLAYQIFKNLRYKNVFWRESRSLILILFFVAAIGYPILSNIQNYMCQNSSYITTISSDTFQWDKILFHIHQWRERTLWPYSGFYTLLLYPGLILAFIHLWFSRKSRKPTAFYLPFIIINYEVMVLYVTLMWEFVLDIQIIYALIIIFLITELFHYIQQLGKTHGVWLSTKVALVLAFVIVPLGFWQKSQSLTVPNLQYVPIEKYLFMDYRYVFPESDLTFRINNELAEMSRLQKIDLRLYRLEAFEQGEIRFQKVNDEEERVIRSHFSVLLPMKGLVGYDQSQTNRQHHRFGLYYLPLRVADWSAAKEALPHMIEISGLDLRRDRYRFLYSLVPYTYIFGGQDCCATLVLLVDYGIQPNPYIKTTEISGSP